MKNWWGKQESSEVYFIIKIHYKKTRICVVLWFCNNVVFFERKRWKQIILIIIIIKKNGVIGTNKEFHQQKTTFFILRGATSMSDKKCSDLFIFIKKITDDRKNTLKAVCLGLLMWKRVLLIKKNNKEFYQRHVDKKFLDSFSLQQKL